MKLNFRKIASVLTSAVMLSSTVAIATAASFPAPFVNNGAGDYAIVYGSTSVQGTDNVAALNVQSFLSDKVTTTTSSEPVADVNDTITGDNFLLQKTNDKFNLGDTMQGMISAGLTSEELPVILADGTYTNLDGNDYDYTQTIDLKPLTLGWYQDSDFNGKKPFVGFKEASGTDVLKYTLEFDTTAEAGLDDSDVMASLKNTVINIMGRDYYISNAQNTSNGAKLTLLDTANSVRITEGDTQTITVGDKSYSIKVVAISGSPAKATLEVNGVELSTDLAAGSTAKVKGENTYVGVRRLSVGHDAVLGTATVTIGTGQLVLENGQEVQLNGKALSDLSQYEDWTVTADIAEDAQADLESISLTWATGNDVALYSGQSWTMPGLDSLKLSMSSFVVPAAEVTSIAEGDDSAQVSTTVKDGDIDLNIIFGNSTDFTGVGAAADERLITSDINDLKSATSTGSKSITVPLSKDFNDYFAATWVSSDSAETYLYKLNSITSSSGNNETTLTNLADSTKTLTFSKPGNSKSVGDLTFTLQTSSYSAKNATINVTASSGTVYIDRIATKDGLTMMLPDSSDVGADYKIQFIEAKADDGNIGTGKSFNVTVAPSTDGVEPTSVEGADMIAEEYRSDTKVGYVISDLASYLEWNNPDSGLGDLTVNYHNSEAYAKVYVSEAAATIGGGGGSAGTVVVTDSQVQSVSSKNLVVVGGSCVNTVAAKLISPTSTAPICGADWQALTNVGAGSFLIQTFASPYATGKVATLVAGYDAADTTNAVNALKVTGAVDTTVGNKYIGNPGQTLQLTTV